jgi:hypothetical protein
MTMKSSSSNASSRHETSVSGGTSGHGTIRKAWAKFTQYTGRLSLKNAFASHRQRGNESPGFVVVRTTPLPIPATFHDPDMNILPEDEEGRSRTPLKGHEETESPDVEAEFPGPHGSDCCGSSLRCTHGSTSLSQIAHVQYKNHPL